MRTTRSSASEGRPVRQVRVVPDRGKVSVMMLGSHAAWKMRDSLPGQEVRHGASWKVVREVIVSPNRNAYAIVFTDGSMLDMSSYCTFEVR